MKLVLSLLKNEYSTYRTELSSFADYGITITDLCNYYLENHKNISKQRKQQILSIRNKINALAIKLKELN